MKPVFVESESASLFWRDARREKRGDREFWSTSKHLPSHLRKPKVESCRSRTPKKKFSCFWNGSSMLAEISSTRHEPHQRNKWENQSNHIHWDSIAALRLCWEQRSKEITTTAAAFTWRHFYWKVIRQECCMYARESFQCVRVCGKCCLRKISFNSLCDGTKAETFLSSQAFPGFISTLFDVLRVPCEWVREANCQNTKNNILERRCENELERKATNDPTWSEMASAVLSSEADANNCYFEH